MLIEAMMVVAQIMVLTALLGIMMLVVALAKIVVVVVAARHVVLVRLTSSLNFFNFLPFLYGCLTRGK